MVKKVAIIGAGSCGLPAIKCCLDEGLEPTCFEKSDDIGGLWKFQDDAIEGKASIYKSLTINTSKEMMTFSDFPIPEDYPNYMHNSQVMDYFRSYAKHFGLLPYICFKTTVLSVTKQPDFSITGQWNVVTETSGIKESFVFDAVLVCTGHHVEPYLPLASFPGLKKFKGKILHSWEYKHPGNFRDKRVVMIGLGNSGADITVDLSHAVKKVFLSTRSGSWIISRVSCNGYPMDVTYFTRFRTIVRHIIPMCLLNMWEENKVNSRFDHTNYGLKPSHRFFSKYPIVGDDLPNGIISGRIAVKPDVKEFTETAVIFEDGTKEENIDAVIFATGYSFSFPFLEESVIKTKNNHVSLYKYVFPPFLEKPTLAMIGLLQPLGAIMPIAELQVRGATRVFKGLIKLPPEDVMMADIIRKKKENEKRYVPSRHIALQVQYVNYMDEISSFSGVKPNMLSLLLKDPKLAWEVFFGPCTPIQFRLMGPGKWNGAREAILSQRKRIIKATKTRDPPNDSKETPPALGFLFLKSLWFLAFVMAIFVYL
ncbi:flavin-containing monooxygenase 5-like isoform X2 [Monodelphis domestica]|uniref:flavin-containing monooxygenase 5-like isoform X2 n=1 Tax=Monodelphis domestica TaxID=13616 RepID=UPI0024E208CF|nr:flavin-containing monooxygenase 5-like isoform X2 [Monodelphis domestica]